MRQHWVAGNRFELLENGEEFFPRVFEAIAAARSEVLIETFILFEDKVGMSLQEAVLTAARRGARVELTVDGYGSHELTDAYIAKLTQAGVSVHIFEPQPRLFGWRYNVFRRMHRKIVVIDQQLAFVGGINYSADHLADFGPEGKQDYSMKVEGPIVAEIRNFALSQLPTPKSRGRWFRRPRRKPVIGPAQASGEGLAQLVIRDNGENRTNIERHYRAAIRAARHRIVIANAYFFPGYRFLRDLRRAAKRGVEVSLILQGEPDMPIVKTAAELLHEDLVKAGVRIFEYCERPFHGKVALVDDHWVSVGSSNLDPLSLSLNLEANLMVRDTAFNAELHARLERLMTQNCREITRDTLPPPPSWSKLRSFVVYHLLRLYPRWATLLPSQKPYVVSLTGGPKSPV